MKIRNLQDVHDGIRALYARAVEAGNKGNLLNAIAIMREALRCSPGLMEARRKLREYEKAFTKKLSPFAKLGTQCSAFFAAGKIRKLMESDPVAAMARCEELLADNLNNPVILLLLAEAAARADAPFIAVDTLLTLREYYPESVPYARKLAEYYRLNAEPQEALRIFQMLASQHPNDKQIRAELREASALAVAKRNSMRQESASNRSRSVKDDALTIQLAENTLRDVGHAKILIARYNEELAQNDSNDLRRKLAEAYYVAGDFNNAIFQLETVAKRSDALDPALDKQVERAYMGKYNQILKDLRAKVKTNPALAEQLKEAEQVVFDFQVERAERRSQAYPNDALLHFDLGVLYVEAKRYTEARQELEHSLRSPQKRTQSLVLLGRCDQAEQAYENALRHYDAALKEMVRLDWARFEAMYLRAQTLEALGRLPEALDMMHDIYQSDTRFRDVAAQIQRLTALCPEAAAEAAEESSKA